MDSQKKWVGFAIRVIGFVTTWVQVSVFGDISDVVGRYEGAWTNLTFGSTGKAIIEISATPPTAAVQFDMDGFVFGAFNPPPIAMFGDLVGDTIELDNKGVGRFGDIKGLVDAGAGTFTATITNVPGGFIRLITASGTVKNGRMDLQYIVNFTAAPSPTNPANGVMVVNRPTPLLISAKADSSSQLRLTWVGGKPPFQVQIRDRIDEGSWQSLGSSISTNTIAIPYGGAKRFYRVTGS